METAAPHLICFRGFPATGNELPFYAKPLETHEDGLLIECVALHSVIIINLCVGGFSARPSVHKAWLIRLID